MQESKLESPKILQIFLFYLHRVINLSFGTCIGFWDKSSFTLSFGASPNAFSSKSRVGFKDYLFHSLVLVLYASNSKSGINVNVDSVTVYYSKYFAFVFVHITSYLLIGLSELFEVCFPFLLLNLLSCSLITP